jgi:hypothetical protein
MSITCVIWGSMTFFIGVIRQFCFPRDRWRSIPHLRNQRPPKHRQYLHVLRIQHGILLLRPALISPIYHQNFLHRWLNHLHWIRSRRCPRGRSLLLIG